MSIYQHGGRWPCHLSVCSLQLLFNPRCLLLFRANFFCSIHPAFYERVSFLFCPFSFITFSVLPFLLNQSSIARLIKVFLVRSALSASSESFLVPSLFSQKLLSPVTLSLTIVTDFFTLYFLIKDIFFFIPPSFNQSFLFYPLLSAPSLESTRSLSSYPFFHT